MSKELEILEGIDKKIDLNKESVQKEITQLKEVAEKEKKEFAEEVKKLNEELTKKGATIESMVGEVKELKAKGGRIRSAVGSAAMDIKSLIATAIVDNKENFMKMTEKGQRFENLEIKTVADISSANLATDNYISYLSPAPGQRPFGQTRFRQFVNTIQSATDFVQFPRQNTPAGEGSFGRQATEGVAKAQVDYDWTMIDLTLTAMAGYSIVSRQSLRNILFLQTYLPQNLMEDLEDKEDTDFANKLVAAATGSSTTAGITATVERLVYFIKNLIQAKHKPNYIVADPAVWAAMLIVRPGTDNPYSLPNVVTVSTTGQVQILGVPMYPVNWLTGNRVIVGDFTKTSIVESEGLSLRQADQHASQFVANQVTFLLERTHNLAIFRPDAFITTTLS